MTTATTIKYTFAQKYQKILLLEAILLYIILDAVVSYCKYNIIIRLRLIK